MCASGLKEVAISVLGPQKQQKKEGWRDQEYEEAVAKKEKAYKIKIGRDTRANRAAFREERRKTTKLARQKKRRVKKKEAENLEILRDRKEARKFYKNINQSRKHFVPSTTSCKDKQGNMVTCKEEVVKRCEEYFSELLNGEHRATTQEEENPVSNPQYNNNEVVPPPTRAGVVTAIQRLKNNKSAGSDGIPAELFKAAGDTFIDCFHQLITQIWIEEKMPEDWNESVICPIFKKGDKHLCSNYRGISLLNIAYKILSSIMTEKLKPYITSIIGPYQAGFMPGKSTSDQIFTLRMILEKAWEFQGDYHHLFVDFKQAYDTPERDHLFTAMNHFDIPAKLIKLCRMTLSNTWSCVRAAGTTTKKFRTYRGLRQGDALSCGLFNIILELIMKVANIGTNRVIFNKSDQILGYADDLDLIGRSKGDVEKNFLAIESAASSIGLKVNEDKTKYLFSTRSEERRSQLGSTVTMGDFKFEVVEKFTYLGSEINTQNDITREIRRRIVLANRCLHGLSKFMRSRDPSKETKLKLYNELILAVLLYGSESWTLRAKDEQLLNVFERKVLRLIYGPVCREGEWRSRYNHELYALSRQQKVTDKIKVKRLN